MGLSWNKTDSRMTSLSTLTTVLCYHSHSPYVLSYWNYWDHICSLSYYKYLNQKVQFYSLRQGKFITRFLIQSALFPDGWQSSLTLHWAHCSIDLYGESSIVMDRGTGSGDKTSEVRVQIHSALKVISNHQWLQMIFLGLLSLTEKNILC